MNFNELHSRANCWCCVYYQQRLFHWSYFSVTYQSESCFADVICGVSLPLKDKLRCYNSRCSLKQCSLNSFAQYSFTQLLKH